MNQAARRQLCKELRQRETPAEEFLWELVRDRRFEGLKFRRQHPLGNFVADFYCSEYRLAIELDGVVHRQQTERDKARDEAIQLHHVRILRIKNQEVLTDPERVLGQVRDRLTPLPPLHMTWRGG